MNPAQYRPRTWLDSFFTDIDKDLYNTREGFTPEVDIVEEENGYVLRTELPGVKKEDLKVEVKENRLTLSGKKDSPWEVKSDRYRHFEARYGNFNRSFLLPRSLEGSAIQAEFKEGVLVLRIPKAQQALPKTIEIA